MDEKVENPYIIDCIVKNYINYTRFVIVSEIAMCKKRHLDAIYGDAYEKIGEYQVIVILKGHNEEYNIGEFDKEEDMDRFYNKVRAKMEVLATPIVIPSLK